MLQNLRIGGSIVLVVLISSRAAFAVTVPLSFSGPEQTFAATVDLTTNLFATLDGTVLNPVSKAAEVFTTTPPFEHGATSLGGPYPFTGTPLSDDSLSPTMEIVGGHLTNISNLYLDLLAGDIVPLVSETVTVTTTSKVALLKNLTVDASIEVTDLAFRQSAPGTFAPTGPGIGTFAIPGYALAQYENAKIILASLVHVPIYSGVSVGGSTTFLTGQYKISGTPGNTTVELDIQNHYEFGSLLSSKSLAKFDFTAASPLALTISAVAGLGLVTGYDVNLHLVQSGIVVPEPSSIALLFIGSALLSVSFGFRRSRIGSRSGSSIE